MIRKIYPANKPELKTMHIKFRIVIKAMYIKFRIVISFLLLPSRLLAALYSC